MTTVEITKKKDNGKEVNKVEITEMNVLQMSKVASGISKIIRLVNGKDKIKHIIETFNNIYKEEQANAEEYYKAQKKAKKKVEDIETYDIGAKAFTRAGTLVWDDILDVLADLMEEAPESLFKVVSSASGIDLDTLMEQDFDTFMSVFEATVEENDVQKLIDRIKKSKGTYSKLLPMFTNKEA